MFSTRLVCLIATRPTRTKDDCVPDEKVIRAWCTRNASRRIGRELLEIPNEATTGA